MSSPRFLFIPLALLVCGAHGMPAAARPYGWKKPARKITGTLVIESHTHGARVFVNGDEVGSLPLQNPINLMPGSYSVKVAKPGYTEYIETIRLRAGRTVRLEVDLFPVKGILSLDSAPSGARVYLGGKFLGKTPLVELEVEPGSHRMRVARTGFHDAIRTVEAKAGAQVKLVLQLIPLPAEINPLIAKPAPKRWYDKWWVWAAAAGGVVALVTAIVVPVAIASQDPVKDFAAERTFRVPLRTSF